ncbi:ribosomal protein S18-alanine N-acetyltransferase [Streptococcus pluranimalium]
MAISSGSNLDRDALAASIFAILDEVYNQSPWSQKQIVDDLSQDNTDYFFLSDGDRVIAFLSVQDLFGELEITNIAVLKAYQGQGLAKQLLLQLASVSQPIFLEVRASNIRARQLYQSFGFEAVGQRKNYYHHPVEDAIIMKREGQA